MLRWALRLMTVTVLVASGPSSSDAKDRACTDGVNCLCDQLTGNTRIVLCEDFENPALDDGTGNGWVNAGYGGYADDHDCPDGPGSLDGDEGTDNDDCFNIVTENSCDVAGQTDCVLEGTRALGAKFDNGRTHGHFGGRSLSPRSNFGITYAVKMSNNFVRGRGPGFKPTEWNSSTQAFHWGQDENSSWDAKSIKAAPGSGPLETTNSDLNWNAKLFFFPAAAPSVANVTVTKGRVWATNANVVSWAPFASDFPGGQQSWPQGTWGCLSTKVTGMGTTNTSVQQWWQGPNDPTQTLVVSFSGLDTTNLPSDTRQLNAIRFNNYFNGPNQCGYGATDGAPPNCSYANLPRAYRYEDNYVVTNGDPLTCAEIGFGSGSAPAPPVNPPLAPPVLLP